MAEEFSLKATITGDTSELKQSLDSGKDSLREFGIDVNKIQEFLTGGAGLAAAFAIVAVQGLEAAKAFDEAGAKLGKMTGETGAALDGLKTSLANVTSAGVVQGVDDISDAMGMLHIRLGLVGADLEASTMQFSSFADVTGQTVAAAVTDVTKLMAQWNIPASELGVTLDKLTLTTQLTGEQASVLTQTLIQSGPVFKSAGIDIDQAAGMLIGFSKAGIDASTATGAINIALRKFAQEGVTDSGAALTALINEIQNTSDKSRATTLAVEGFGRAGITMATAIRSGALDVKEWTKQIQNAEGALERTDKATESFTDVTDKLGGQLQGLLAESFKSVLEISKPFLQMLSQAVSAFEKLPGPVKQFIETTIILVSALNVAKIAMVAFGASTTLALGPISIIAAAIGILAIGIKTAVDAQDEYNQKVKNNVDLAKEHYEQSTKIIGSVTELNKNQKLNAEQVAELIKLYPELTAQLKDGNLTLGDTAELTKKTSDATLHLNAALALKKVLDEKKSNYADMDEAQQHVNKLTKTVNELANARSVGEKRALEIYTKELERYRGVVDQAKKKNEELTADESNYRVASMWSAQQISDFNKKTIVATISDNKAGNAVLTNDQKKTEEDRIKLELENDAKLRIIAKKWLEDHGVMLQQHSAFENAEIDKVYENKADKAAQEKKLWEETMSAVGATVSATMGDVGGLFTGLEKLVTNVMGGITGGIKDVGQFVSDLAGQVAQAVTSIFGVIDKATQQSSQREIAAIDKEIAARKKALTAEQAAIDKETQAKLKAAGVATKTTLENDQETLASALATGDAITIKAAQDQLTRDTITQQGVDAKQLAADKEAAVEEELTKKKADLAYKAAHAQWELQIIQAAAGAALAIIQCYSSLNPIAATVAAVLVGAVTGVEIGMLASNEPKPAAFAKGTAFAPGGASMLAEEGPELVMSPSVHNLAKGSTVLTAAQTAKAMGGKGSTINVNVGQATYGTVGEIARAISSESRKLAFAGVL